MSPFKWKDIDLNLLVAFQAIYQTHSVSLAAEQCYVSQSAMSHTLQRMRTLFDDPLFIRSGIRMEPTARAKDIAPQIDRLLASIKNELLTKPVFSARQYSGIWKIGLTDYAEQLFAPSLYDAINRQSPHSQISFYNVNRGNYRQMVENEQIDVVIGSIDNLDQRFISQRLYTEQHLCLFDPESVPFHSAISIEEFTSIEHALVSPDGHLQTKVDKELSRFGYQRRVSVASRNFLTVRRLLLGRKLICIVPKRFAQSQMYSHGLKALPAPIKVADFDIKLLFRKALEQDDHNRWLRDLVADIILNAPPEQMEY
ncbi:LysR family transcriptional regulator [Thalassomonas sp. RHCl1]|uniref:LysR family transcriptional regulator n=1 Tax=Thalassomonas sp. RHCl1 TaxID=2995320 RepID=UPI00248AA8FA|nr:LysR family transcriptional regulator [Thalassomonas sp. RHCl1]